MNQADDWARRWAERYLPRPRDRDAFMRPLPPVSPIGAGVAGQTAATSDPTSDAEEAPADARKSSKDTPTGAASRKAPTLPDLHRGNKEPRPTSHAGKQEDADQGLGQDPTPRRQGRWRLPGTDSASNPTAGRGSRDRSVR